MITDYYALNVEHCINADRGGGQYHLWSSSSWICITRFQFHGKKILLTLIDLYLQSHRSLPDGLYPHIWTWVFFMSIICDQRDQRWYFAITGNRGSNRVWQLIPIYFKGDHTGAFTRYGWGRGGSADEANGFTIFRKITFHISNGHCFMESSLAQQEQWESLVRCLFIRTSTGEKQIRCRFILNFISGLPVYGCVCGIGDSGVYGSRDLSTSAVC